MVRSASKTRWLKRYGGLLSGKGWDARIGGCALPATGWSAQGSDARFGDLKLFEPKTMCPLIAVRDREER